MKKIYPKRYIPKNLSETDKKKQANEIEKSKEKYKKNEYYTRKKINSFKSKKSKYILEAQKIYNIEKIIPSEELAKKTGCSIEALNKIVEKGEGAYYSSGSRPNQTAPSWGYARLASAITGGKAAVVDFKIIDEGCSHSGKAYKFALEAKQKFGKGRGTAPKTEV